MNKGEGNMDQIKTGNYIAGLRKEKNMTQRELAERINVSDKTISKWETGKSMPDLDCIGALCETLGVSVNEIISGESLSADDYSRKAEETIMTLMEENEKNKKGNMTMTVVGIVMLIIAIIMLFFGGGSMGMAISPALLIDLPSLILITVIMTGLILVSGKRDKIAVFELIDKSVISVGIFVCLFTAIVILSRLDDPSSIGPHLAVCILSLFYAIILKLAAIAYLAAKN